jgi:hypothetical protein
LWDFSDFVLDFQDVGVVEVDSFDCSVEFWRGTIAAENVNQQSMVGSVVCFHKVDKANIQG